MAHNINVEAHLKRYTSTDLADIVRLIAGLTNLVEERKSSTINKLKEQLELLEQGQIPVEPAKSVPPRTRGGKKIKQEEQEAQ
jgi:hypothetical protein